MSEFSQEVNVLLAEISKMLVAKNEAYGDSALNPARVFSKASAEEQLLVRIDDKISRIQRGHDYGDEDTVQDLIGYLVLLTLARRRAANDTEASSEAVAKVHAPAPTPYPSMPGRTIVASVGGWD